MKTSSRVGEWSQDGASPMFGLSQSTSNIKQHQPSMIWMSHIWFEMVWVYRSSSHSHWSSTRLVNEPPSSCDSAVRGLKLLQSIQAANQNWHQTMHLRPLFAPRETWDGPLALRTPHGVTLLINGWSDRFTFILRSASPSHSQGFSSLEKPIKLEAIARRLEALAIRLEARPLLLSWRPSLWGWRPLLLGWRPGHCY